MHDSKILQEIADNARSISHEKYGEFVISRPTNRILSEIDTIRTRSINRDLQAREVVEDPTTGNTKEVPAFLTKSAKADQLRFHGLWTMDHEVKTEEASDHYREVCFELDAAGFAGAIVLDTELETLRAELGAILPNTEKVTEAIQVVIPQLDTVPSGPDLDTEEELDRYSKAKSVLKKAGKSMQVDKLLERADKLHKLCGLYKKGVTAQADLVAMRMIEFSLFADTLEARADKAVQVAKVFYCAKLPDGTSKWKSFAELEEDIALPWLLGEIEKFERIDPDDTVEDISRRDRFNFLVHLPTRNVPSEDSPEVTDSNPDGNLVGAASTSSTED